MNRNEIKKSKNMRAQRKTKETIQKGWKNKENGGERAGRKKNDREATVTRCSRLLSRHSAWLSRERSVIARDRSQIGIAHGLDRLSHRRCYHRDRWTEVHATRHDAAPSLSLSLSLFSLFSSLFLLSSILASISIRKLRDRAQLKNSTA